MKVYLFNMCTFLAFGETSKGVHGLNSDFEEWLCSLRPGSRSEPMGTTPQISVSYTEPEPARHNN